MNYFFVINARKFKQYLFIALAIIFSAAIVYSEQSNVSVFMNSEPSAIYSVQTEKKVIALTFDISWGETTRRTHFENS